MSARLAVLGVFWTLITLIGADTEVNTTLSDSFTQPAHVHEGEDGLLTCVVRNPPNSATVIWKKESQDKKEKVILTSGDTRVTSDNRFNVLHDRDGDVWVLVIKKVRTSDAGLYTCEVNIEPVLRSFHKLVVLPLSMLPPNVTASSVDTYSNYKGNGAVPSITAHNYVSCCEARNVTKRCFGFCSLVSILEGTTGQEPEVCEDDFPNIVSCMADGRDHVPCCIREGVPDLCQDLCRGDYTRITDSVKSHYSCAAYTERTLACIADGVVILPGPPTSVEAESPTERSLLVQWHPPMQNAGTVTGYLVNVTQLRPLDPTISADDDADDYSNTNLTRTPPKTIQLKIEAPGNSSLVDKLLPFTMYEVSVTAYNAHGKSLPSVRLRTITMPPGEYRLPAGPSPPLPDVRSCCINAGVSHATCIEKLCDPRLADLTDVTDLMICAPWANPTFQCLTDGRDHTPCCKERGLPELCLDFCAANFTKLDYRHFRCLRYIRDYGSCLLRGYGVLPGPPKEMRAMQVEAELAVVTWSPPEELGDTVRSYALNYRALTSEEYTVVESTHPPFLLADLKPDTDYEVYVEGENEHGVGGPSSRILFRTLTMTDQEVEQEEEEVESGYNVTACCTAVKLRGDCMPLCDYDAKMSDVRTLALTCSTEFPKLLRCGAGGRNHTACCERRGVFSACQSLCAGIVSQPLLTLATTCAAFIGNIVQCFEEGTGLLPGPVRELQAVDIRDGAVTLLWEPPDDSTPAGYEVHYRAVDVALATTTPGPAEDGKIEPLKETVVNASQPPIDISGLAIGALYRFSVVAINEHGSSLPSSVLLLNVSSSAFNGTSISGLPSAPHSLVVSSHSATWVSISWQPPEISHHFETFTYRVHSKAMSETNFTVRETLVTSMLLGELRPNTQHVVYVTANNTKGESSPSETLIAWTDPAYPAFVEPPTIRPLNLVMEGGSMTVLCIAMGLPLPKVSLYVSGRLVRQERTRHMVTVIHNVTRDMDNVACYADNGYGTPMQASRRINISHRPYINASGVTMALLGDTAVLECRVEAHPEPSMVFWRDQGGRVPIIHGGRFSVDNRPLDDQNHYLMQLTITSVQEDDSGSYYCHAVNAFGTYTQTVTVRIRKPTGTSNISQCCADQNVSAACLDACDIYVDVDQVLNKPECIPDFNKLVRCAADGSDHRSCCSQWGVPRRCLDWCRGDPVENSKLCGLSFTKHIVNCFQEGKERLPGPPLNLRVQVIDSRTAQLSWDPPAKNPGVVEIYRVFWRPIGAKQAIKNDTKETTLLVTGLKETTPYECVVKAGNHYGTSVLTEPVQFVTLPKFVTSASTDDSSPPQVGVAVGVILALVLVMAVLGGGVWFLRRRRLLSLKTAGGVAFENPSYLREMNANANAAAVANNADAAHSQVSTTDGVSNGRGQQQSNSSSSGPTEVPPTLYEELRLGQEGVGFKRLKP